jgi:diguanylate cyclase (GGDEF)-like protein
VSNKAIGVFLNQPVDLAELAEQQLFHQVNVIGLEPLLTDCPSLKLDDGAVLIEPGHVGQCLYLVLAGRLEVYDGEATDEPLAVIQKGECIGLMSLMDQQPCHVRVVVTQACRLLVIDEERFLALINSSTAISRNVLSMAMQYMRGKIAVAERARLQKRMEQNPNVDGVTGLHNQRWLDDMLERQIIRSAMDQTPLSLLAINIESLSDFRTEFGDEITDFALGLVAKIVTANVRPTDMVARHNSDRFLVVLPETDAAHAEFVEHRVRDAIAQTAIEIPDACRLPPFHVTTGTVQMKSFVAARKLIEDAINASSRQEPEVTPLSAAG